MENALLEEAVADLELDALLAVENDLLDVSEIDNLPQDIPAEENEKEKELSKESKNAIRCRRHREKKKQMIAAERLENAKLKREREVYRQKLGDLQTEVQQLRGQGVMDLSKENELLKAEIKKHRHYIERVVDVALNTPLEVEATETMRLLRAGVESGASHVVGLVYSSMSELEWKRGEVYGVDVPGLTCPDVRLHYQFLPHGSTPSTARRLNMRTEYCFVEVDWSRFADSYWIVASTPAIIQQQLGRVPWLGTMKMSTLYPRTKISETEEMFAMSVSSYGLENTPLKKKQQLVLVSAIREVMVHNSAFPKESRVDGVGENEMVKAKVVFSSSCNWQPKDQSEEFDHVKELNTSGLLFREGPNGTCCFSSIASSPLYGQFHDFIVSGAMNGETMVNEKGRLHDNFTQCENVLLENTTRVYNGDKWWLELTEEGINSENSTVILESNNSHN